MAPEKDAETLTIHNRLDRIGAGMSLACAIHCLLMPLVLGVLPLIGLEFLADHLAEQIFVTVSIVLALLSICWGYRTHGRSHVFLVLLLSALLIAIGIFLVSERSHIYFVVAGALGITITHLLNQRLCRSCSHCDEHAC